MTTSYIPKGDEFRINTYTADNQQDPSVASLANGGFVVTWTSNGQDGSGLGVYGQVYSSEGSPVGGEFLVNGTRASSQSNPSVTGLPDGGFIVTWTSPQNGFLDVYGRLYSSDRSVFGAEFRINATTLYSQQNPSITSLANGNFVTTWDTKAPGYPQDLGQDGSGSGIYGRIYRSYGGASPFHNEFRVNTYTANDQQNPSITSLANGGFVVTWTSNGQDGSGLGVYGQVYNDRGQRIGNEFLVNTYTAGNQSNPSVTGLANGGFVVTWDSNGQDGSGLGVYGQVYRADGSPIGGEFRVNTYTAGSQSTPSVTGLAEGGFVVTWTSNGQDGSGLGVYGQLFLQKPETPPPPPSGATKLRLETPSGAALDMVQVRVTLADGSTSTATATEGRLVLDAGVSAVRLDATRPYNPQTGDPQITVGDALDALRLAVGLAPSFGAAQAVHFIAADLNRDGQVTAADALDILRAAVGLNGAAQPDWLFLDAATDWSALDLSRSNTGLTADMPTGLLLPPDWDGGDLALTGILLGAVTGQT